MSHSLPPHPNLEHLKKQAKDLLQDLKQDSPSSQLADAQHAIAREYGFVSWPKLKAYVESLSRTDDDVSEKKTPFVGKWTANLEKSKRHPANPFQSAIIEFEVVGNVVTIHDVVIDDLGHEQRSKNIIQVDGHEYPSENGSGYVLIASWRGPQVIETFAKKDGQLVGWGTYEISDDGKTLTISGDQQMIVLDRNGLRN